MISYSIDGYLAAVCLRTAPTLLVEGISDRWIVGRAIHDLEFDSDRMEHSLLIDTVDLIQDDLLPSGNRERVEFVANRAAAESISIAAFVDREYREFDTTEEIRDNINGHYRDGTIFWTRGHSIENYLLQSSYIIAYIRMRYADIVSSSSLNVIQSEYPDLLALAASISLATRDAQVLTRCSGACQLEHWKTHEDVIESFDVDSFVKLLVGRGVDELLGETIVTGVASFREKIAECNDHALLTWIAHGHVGWDVVWSGIASRLLEMGIDRHVCEEIASGQRKEKLRYLSEAWARDTKMKEPNSPEELWTWIHTAVNDKSQRLGPTVL